MRQHSNFLRQATLWLLLPVLSPLPVQASQSTNQQVSQPAEVTKGQLEQLHIRNIILQAEVQGAQLQRQLEENQAGAGTIAPSLPGAIAGDTSLPGQPARTVPSNNRPVVLEINGRDQKLRATLQLPSGQSLVVSPGSRIPGLESTVRSITLAGVTLSDGTLLAFGD
ncbi:type IV pilus biogenesis protein PilP [Citrobacter freundii]|uniref:Type IV pilus biogenesis protein PilP n=1 Tax=Citrobacter pasteurii TaxID=1563222 RepID=A0ABX8KE70_9ENTR|nr:MULTISPECIES: type IV pilus biogenesis protein PilP [Citrobacter]EGN2315731.1 type IV pilus biogenesis protein PilP [Escherichia coli]HED2482798.1 type IV pilus biogenesis protein PilP [Citrobacter youngae]AYY47068.1 type IV pilus biogenesis protein PilP [Citrobacter freundii]MBJ9559447.1 type IV pilus biogenesis protein PilP [Citrobacter sp. FDAARGOS_156]MCT1497450.1 type IV pilus biogenesis protein PilP [Citrobacter freundii]